MSKKHYEWGAPGVDYPVIKQHSIAKHEILKSYLIEYFKTLALNPSRDVFKLTLVDGFSGGGAYCHQDTKEIVLGSPFIMLEAVKEAQIEINLPRSKKLIFDVDYIFIEKNRGAHSFLEYELVLRGYGSEIGKSIFLINSSFQGHSEKVFDHILKKTPKASRAVFLLDQYGYSDVSPSLVNNILRVLPGSEVILTYAVDSMLNYVSDSITTDKILKKIQLPDLFRGRSIIDIKSNERDWRLFIQSTLYHDFVRACGASFFTSFFIRSSQGHGDYWLMHFSQKARARDVMTQIHWNKNNHFIHYGGPGMEMFNMLGYRDDKDDSLSGQASIDAFCFDNVAKSLSVTTLKEQIPRMLYCLPNGVSFGEFFNNSCNTTPASSQIIKETLIELMNEKDVDVFNSNGVRKRSRKTIDDSDQLVFPKQTKLIFGS